MIIIEANPERHFGAIADLLNTQETEPNTAGSLSEWYQKQLNDGIQFMVAIEADEQVAGFNCLYRDNLNIEGQYGLTLIVDPAYRGQGLGSSLYKDLLERLSTWGGRSLRARVRDTCEEGIRFAKGRGFVEKWHSIEMMFDLNGWDNQRYEKLLEDLEIEGFNFTNMAELGDTQAARRKLYTLNNEAAATDPGNGGAPPWASFEEFERDVCSSSWYHPDGQIVAIDTGSGNWAAMSAITIFESADHAYNLFTGTDVHYRGRKLAQAVKGLALRWARNHAVKTVRTSHNSENSAMIAIDTKLGYKRTPGVLIMVKEL